MVKRIPRAAVRAKAFLFTNAAIVGVAVAERKISQSCFAAPTIHAAAIAYVVALLRIVFLLSLVQWSTVTKKKLNSGGPKRDEPVLALWGHVLGVAVPGELAELCLAYWIMQPEASERMSLVSIEEILVFALGFVVKSFSFEVLFDFFHYVVHRCYHENRWLYKSIHKAHHAFLHPSPISTYYLSPFDLLLSNVVPFGLALCLLPFRLSTMEIHLQIAYKTFVEIAGHAGIETNSTSFPQAVVLPKLFGIEMRTNDHDLHHTSTGKPCNFAKRFTLWDKVFGTYENPSQLARKRLLNERKKAKEARRKGTCASKLIHQESLTVHKAE